MFACSGPSGPCSGAIRRKSAPIAAAHVRLIPRDLVMIRDASGAELDAGICTLPSEQLELQPQLEIAIRLRGAEKFVSRDLALQRATDDGAILDAENREIPLPACEGLPVKNLDAALAASGQPRPSEVRVSAETLSPLRHSARPLHRVGQQRLERLMVMDPLVVAQRDPDDARGGVPGDPDGGVRLLEPHARRGLGQHLD